MTTNRDETVNAAVRAMGDDRVIASVRAARDAYAAAHGHDVGAIFKDIRAAQEAAGRAYFRHVEPLAEAIAPITTQLSAVFQQLAVSLGPVNEGLRKLAEASAPYLAKWSELAPRLAEWSRTVDALNEVGWLPYHTHPSTMLPNAETTSTSSTGVSPNTTACGGVKSATTWSPALGTIT